MVAVEVIYNNHKNCAHFLCSTVAVIHSLGFLHELRMWNANAIPTSTPPPDELPDYLGWIQLGPVSTCGAKEALPWKIFTEMLSYLIDVEKIWN